MATYELAKGMPRNGGKRRFGARGIFSDHDAFPFAFPA